MGRLAIIASRSRSRIYIIATGPQQRPPGGRVVSCHNVRLILLAIRLSWYSSRSLLLLFFTPSTLLALLSFQHLLPLRLLLVLLRRAIPWS